MGETYVTLIGNVATQPELRRASNGAQVGRFRLATHERRYDRTAERWTDGPTSFYTVWAWRTLGENVCGSLGMGEPVVVHGKLRLVEREDKGLVASIDAVTVGHDLGRGTSAFRRVARTKPEWVAGPPGGPGDAIDEEFRTPLAETSSASLPQTATKPAGASRATGAGGVRRSEPVPA